MYTVNLLLKCSLLDSAQTRSICSHTPLIVVHANITLRETYLTVARIKTFNEFRAPLFFLLILCSVRPIDICKHRNPVAVFCLPADPMEPDCLVLSHGFCAAVVKLPTNASSGLMTSDRGDVNYSKSDKLVSSLLMLWVLLAGLLRT